MIGIEGEEFSSKAQKIYQQNRRRKLFQPKEGHVYEGTRSLQNTK